MNRLAELRKAAGYTQKYVALELGVKAPSVCAWEKGDGNPKQENLIALAKLYGVSVDYLLGNDQPDGEPEVEPAEDKSSANRRALTEAGVHMIPLFNPLRAVLSGRHGLAFQAVNGQNTHSAFYSLGGLKPGHLHQVHISLRLHHRGLLVSIALRLVHGHYIRIVLHLTASLWI